MMYHVLKIFSNIFHGSVIIRQHEDHKQKTTSDKLSAEKVYITGKESKELETQSTALFTPQVRFSLVG